MPAHFSGVYGLKPTHGRVPNWPMSNNDRHPYRPLTQREDAALMTAGDGRAASLGLHLAGGSAQDYASQLKATSMKGKRIAYTRDLHARVDPEIAEVVDRAARVFEAMGAEVSDAVGKLGPELVRFFWPATFSGRASSLAEFEDRMDPGFVAMIKYAQHFTAPQFMQMRLRRRLHPDPRLHGGYDFLLSPAVSVAAFPADRLQPALAAA